mmetsp:Transcript_18324/g.54152  ORF Transcript_18324/g.54152 Transcript_18324/m.54152 type:complete len:248 (+) Transcript_18324:546-1289(+)
MPMSSCSPASSCRVLSARNSSNSRASRSSNWTGPGPGPGTWSAPRVDSALPLTGGDERRCKTTAASPVTASEENGRASDAVGVLQPERRNLCLRSAPTPHMTSPPMVRSDAALDVDGGAKGVEYQAAVLGRRADPSRCELALPGRSALLGRCCSSGTFPVAWHPSHAAAVHGRSSLEAEAPEGDDARAVCGRGRARPPPPNVALPFAATSKTRGTSAHLMPSVTKRISRRWRSPLLSSHPLAVPPAG